MAKTRGKSVTAGTEKKLRNLKPFKPGQSGNPKGRPKGARNRLGTQFLEALEADFNKFGTLAIALVREKKPEVYIKVVADLLPWKRFGGAVTGGSSPIISFVTVLRPRFARSTSRSK
jgi:hypothetical protein